MLTNEAVNRMLEVYKPLDKAQVFNGSSVVVGEKNIFWTNPNNKRISVQPFFITSVGANLLNKLKLSGRTTTGQANYGSTAQINVEDMKVLMTQNYASNINRVGFKASYGGTTYPFIIFVCGDLTGVTGVHTNNTSVYTGGEIINKSLYDFLNDNYSQGIDEKYINFKINTGSGTFNVLTIPSTNITFEVNENSYLEYDLSKYTTGDVNTTESTNSYFESLTEGIEML